MKTLSQIPADAECVACRWFEDIEHINGIEGRGWCHRFPPAFNGEKWESAEQDIERWDMPTVDEGNFCGEWTPIPAADSQ